MPDMSRNQLKENELEDFILTSVEWVKNNRQLASSIAGIATAVIALTAFFFIRYHSVLERANDKLSFAQANIFQGKTEDALKLLDEIISQYPGSAADYKARLQKAEYLLQIRNFDEAQRVIMPVVEKGKPKLIIPLAISVLGATRESSGKYKDAIETYNLFLDKYPEHFLTPKIYESLARVYEISGSLQDAKTTYEKLATLYPSTAWAQRAQGRLMALQTSTNPPSKK